MSKPSNYETPSNAYGYIQNSSKSCVLQVESDHLFVVKMLISSVVSLPPFAPERAFLKEIDGNHFFYVPPVDSFPACWAITFTAVVILLGCH